MSTFEGTKEDLIQCIQSAGTLEELKELLGPSEEQREAYEQSCRRLNEWLLNSVYYHGAYMGDWPEHVMQELTVKLEEIKQYMDLYGR